MSFIDFLKTTAPIAAPVVGAVIASNAATKASKAQQRAAESASEEFRPYADLGEYAAGSCLEILSTKRIHFCAMACAFCAILKL